MVRAKHNMDKMLPKAVEKKYKSKKWVIIVLCIMGLVALIIVVDIKLEDAHKNNGYTREFENNFIASCKSQGSSSSDCECIYKLLKQNYPFEQTQGFDSDPQSTQAKAALEKIIGECKKR